MEERFAAGDHFFRNVSTIFASHITVFRENAGLLLNTPLTKCSTNGCMPTDILLPNDKVATALLAKFMQLYPFLGYREMSRTQSVHLQWGERDLYSSHHHV